MQAISPEEAKRGLSTRSEPIQDQSGQHAVIVLDSRSEEIALRRLRLLARIAVVWALIIVLRLFHLQVFSHDKYKKMARAQQERTVALPAPRGLIQDRDGRTLAISIPKRSICVNPQLTPDLALASEVLARVLKLDPGELRSQMEKAANAGKGFLWVKRMVSNEEYERVKRLNLAGVEFRDESVRNYPHSSLAAHVLGGVDHEERGNNGIELGMEEELEGIPGAIRVRKDVKGRGFASRVESKALPGKTITLTLNATLQYAAERALEQAVEGCHCKTGSLVILDPRTGDILAMASYPTFDPNERVKSQADLAARLNVAIAAPFEPGSVFKLITLSAALEKTPLGPDSPINCLNGTINLYGRVIHEAKRGFGVLPMRQVLAKSSNVCAVQLGLRVGVENLYRYIREFGFGSRTDIPLPAESPGQVFDPRKWSKTSIGSVAMGHEVTATTLQLAQSAATIANNGLSIRPRLVLKKQRPGEEPEWEPVASPVRVLLARNAEMMKDMMKDAVEPGGTGTAARIPGYWVGGKTGSAQIYNHDLRQYTKKYNASFVGIAPLDQPRLVAAVTLNGASQYGGVVAAPVFREVISAALRILDVPRDREWENAIPMMAQAGVAADQMADVASAPEGPVPGLLASGETPTTGAAMDWGANEPAGGSEYLPRAPNLLGKTKRDVAALMAANGHRVEMRGSGVVRTQHPAPGAILRPGERIVVGFHR
jgi:cell division protein FtsI (penicillin-binding protein 3)